MNILFYTNSYPSMGGIETVTGILAQEFCLTLGHNVCVFSLSGDPVTNRVFRGIPVLRPGEKEHPGEALKSILLRLQIDVVIFQDSYAPVQDHLLYALREASRKRTVRLITVEHNTPDSSVLQWKHAVKDMPWWRRMMLSVRGHNGTSVLKHSTDRHRRLAGRSDRYVLLCDSYRTTLSAMVGPELMEKVHAIPNPSVRNVLPAWNQKRKQCLFAGRLTGQKGLDYLREIWPAVVAHCPDWELVIAGDGPMRTELERYFSSVGAAGVRFLGRVSDMDTLYSESSLLLMTSVYEGWPMVLSECMSAGCVPVLFDSFAAAAELVPAGTGVLVQPFSIEGYVSRLTELMRDEAMRSQMAHAAYSSSARYSIGEIVSCWDSLLKGLNSEQ